MKKRIILIISFLVLVLTFIFAETFSIYHFGSVPTLLTTLYLISLFSIFEYLTFSFIYIIRKLTRKEKIETKKIVCLIMFFLALLLITGCIISIDIDWLNYYSTVNSSPFYVCVIVRCVEYLIPSIVLIVISTVLLKKEKYK